MRRSGAPSQNGTAKRQKFVSPAVASYTQGNSRQASGPPGYPVLGEHEDSKRFSRTLPLKAYSAKLQNNQEFTYSNSCQRNTSTTNGNGFSETAVREKADMIALLSKKTWKSPLPCEQPPQPVEPLARIPLSPHKPVNSCDSASPEPASEPTMPVLQSQCPDLKRSSATDTQASSTSSVRYFSVMWCKASKKKHKKWEGDAVLSTSGRSATLYDTEGKIIGRGTGYKVAELESLAEDETLFVGGKEIQVMSVLTEDQFQSGKCFSSASGLSCEKSAYAASASPRVTGTFKPFKNPLQKFGTSSNQNIQAQEKSTLLPKYDPSGENALVMPRPTPEQQWRSNNGGDAQPVVDVVVDPYLANFLRQHQREGVVFLYMCVMGLREHGGLGAVLADDMGLGKTLQCITLIWTLLKQGPYGGRPVVKKVLVITPGSLVKNWYLEFKKWLGTERLNVYAVSGDKRVEDFVKSNMYPVLILSYEMFVRCYEVIKQVPFGLVICDEGHRLKNTAIKTTSLIMSLPCRRRVVLTGTPVQNDLQEFFSIVEFCNPGILGSSSAFRRVYEEPIVASRQPRASAQEKELGKERARELTRLTQMFVLRRTQEINNDYLPPKVELVLFCRASLLQTELYQQLLRSKAVRMCLQSRYQQQTSGSAHLSIIGALKQLCNHPRLIHGKAVLAEQAGERTKAVRASDHGWVNEDDDDSAEDSIYSGLLSLFPAAYSAGPAHAKESGKLKVLVGILSSVWRYSATDKVVLVSNHTKTLDMLQTVCESRGYTCLRLDGQTPTGQRQELVNKFNKLNTHRIFLLSSKAGGVGLNLIGASRLILYDIDWNPANDLQAMARVWRDGQRKRVFIYRLLTTGSIEEKVYQRQISKQGLSGTVMDQTSASSSSSVQFSLEDLKDLFSLNEMTDCETHSMLNCPCNGDPDYVPDQNAASSASSPNLRTCQLGASVSKGAKGQVANLTMAQLLSWKHVRGEFSKQEKSWYLEEAGDSLSYVFWNETNCG
ncbi:DNA repair and recombination protein rad54 [Plakobranchus ocellatus]|uniref:DNA repair and recombination protein rad54 n=1 Tax=Plakobranchus ocellatus TaxID=259542 RepID=A0AAV4BW39_9GAST|nr:DNA repair and recombination protein rad54 [Plakobranchus ocellatus]